jgi:hypothetical protein
MTGACTMLVIQVMSDFQPEMLANPSSPRHHCDA